MYTVSAAITGFGLHVVNRGSPTNLGVTDWWSFPLVSAVSFSGAGAWLLWLRPRLSVGWLALAVGLINASMLACVEYGVWSLDQPGRQPADSFAFWFGNWSWVTGLTMIGLVFPLVLPDGRLLSRRWRPALALSITVVVTSSVDWAITPYEWSPTLVAAGAVNPIGVDWIWEPVVRIPSALVSLAALGIAFGSLVVRLRRSVGVVRQQVKVILLGYSLTVLLWAVNVLLGAFLGPITGFHALATTLAMVPLPAACVVAVLRYRLWDFDVVISRSLLYGGLTVAVVGVYLASVGLLGELLGRTVGAPLAATAVIALGIEPLQRRLRHLVNRFVYGVSEEPFAVLTRVGQRLAGARDAASVADEVLPEVVRSVAAVMRLPYVAIALVDGTRIAHGEPGVSSAEVPLLYGGRRVGQLIYRPRPGGVGMRDRRLLRDLAQHAAVAAHTILLTRDLARSQEELVTAREEERRRLYRDLHDSLGPTLAALALQVETARDVLPADPAAAHRLLQRATPGLRSTVDDVRKVVRGLRPAALDDLGLPAALRELGGSFAAPGFAVTVQADAIPPLPAAVEVAAYRIAAEALSNAARHANATSAQLRLDQHEQRLRLVVEDDGCGYRPDYQDGFGLASMRQRAGELGGSFTITTGVNGSGTHVEALLPGVC